MLEGEQNLIKKAKEGDQASFGQLYDHYIAPLYQIARNKVIDFYRTKKAHVSFENLDEDLLKVVGVSETNLEVTLAVETVKKALTKLTPEQQDVIAMKFIEDLSNDEIARNLGKSEGAVRLLQHRAISNLKEILASWKTE